MTTTEPQPAGETASREAAAGSAADCEVGNPPDALRAGPPLGFADLRLRTARRDSREIAGDSPCLTYAEARVRDAALLVSLYNEAFRADYLRYGECPGYGRSQAQMADSIRRYPKTVIRLDAIPVGVIALQSRGGGAYYLGCLCVIPAYQGRGIGTAALGEALRRASDWRSVSLVTPADHAENLAFYTGRFGFRVTGKSMDGNVEVAHLLLER